MQARRQGEHIVHLSLCQSSTKASSPRLSGTCTQPLFHHWAQICVQFTDITVQQEHKKCKVFRNRGTETVLGTWILQTPSS